MDGNTVEKELGQEAILACITDLSHGLNAQLGLAFRCLNLQRSASPEFATTSEKACVMLTKAVNDVCSNLRSAATDGIQKEDKDKNATYAVTNLKSSDEVAIQDPAITTFEPNADRSDSCNRFSVCWNGDNLGGQGSFCLPRGNTINLDPAQVKPEDSVASMLTRQATVSSWPHKDWMDEDESNDEKSTGMCIEGVLNPNWSWRLCWDLIVIVLVMIDAMVLPYQMSYKDEDGEDGFDTSWLWLTTSFFACDMLISFFTGYVMETKDPEIRTGKLVTKKSRIAKHYLQAWFPIDLVSTIPWGVFADLIAGDGSSSSAAQMAKLTKVVKFIRFLRLMRMLRLAKLASIWERVDAKLGSVLLFQSIALLRVLFVLMGICHWNACVWWIVGQPRSLFTEFLSEEQQLAYEKLPHWTTIWRSYGTGNRWSWLERPKSDAYIFCFYWTLGVMRTMPSEVQPVNKPERIYIMLFMFFAFSAFAICIAQITQTFFKFSERRRNFNDDMAAVRMHLRHVEATESLQTRVKSFLKHLFDKRRIHARENELLKHLPHATHHELKHTQFAHHFSKSDILQDLPPKALHLLSALAEVHDLMAGAPLSIRQKPAKAAWFLMHGRLYCPQAGDNASESLELVDMDCLTSPEVTLSKDTVMAAVCSEMIKVDKYKFFHMQRDNPSLVHRIQQSALRLSEPSGGPLTSHITNTIATTAMLSS